MTFRFGIDLGGTKIEIAALDETNRIVERTRVPTPAGDYQATLRVLHDLIRNTERTLGREASNATVGIGTPGTVSPTTGLLRNANSICLNGQPFKQDFEQLLGREVRIENDANCFALSEAVDGAGRDGRIVFGVILGTGVGGGVVIEGRILKGANAIGCEWGHNSLPWPRIEEVPGPLCYCGRHGCIETFLSGRALAEDHAHEGGGVLRSEEIVSRAGAGDAASMATLERYEERLARALASIINIVDPDVIVLGGGVSNVKRWYDTVPKLWGRHVFADSVSTRLVQNVHGDSSGVRGAAWLWGAGGTPARS
jgi:fructokinase